MQGGHANGVGELALALAPGGGAPALASGTVAHAQHDAAPGAAALGAPPALRVLLPAYDMPTTAAFIHQWLQRQGLGNTANVLQLELDTRGQADALHGNANGVPAMAQVGSPCMPHAAGRRRMRPPPAHAAAPHAAACGCMRQHAPPPAGGAQPAIERCSGATAHALYCMRAPLAHRPTWTRTWHA